LLRAVLPPGVRAAVLDGSHMPPHVGATSGLRRGLAGRFGLHRVLRGMPMSRTILLVRHLPTGGKPTGRIDRHEFASWLAGEGGWEIVPGTSAGRALSEAVTGGARLAVSPVVRAQQTAAAVLAALPSGQAPEVITMTGLREAPLPMIPIPRLRASLDVWGAVTRAAWFV